MRELYWCVCFLLSVLSRCSGHYCNFEVTCQLWTELSQNDGIGFQRRQGDSLASCGSIRDVTRNDSTGYISVLMSDQGQTTGTLISDWYGSYFEEQQLNYTLSFYVSVYKKEEDWRGNITVTLQTLTKKQILKIFPLESPGTWEKQEIDLGGQKGPFRFAVCSTVAAGCLALDDILVQVSNGDGPFREACTFQEFECDIGSCIQVNNVGDLKDDCSNGRDEKLAILGSLPDIAQCTFEVDSCGWHNLTTDQFDWVRHKNQTETRETGPSVDHTRGTEHGYYIYIDVSGKLVGDTASLQSPPLPALPAEVSNITSPFYGSCQLSFYYHMYGHSVDVLEVEVLGRNGNSAIKRNICSIKGNQGNVWKHANITLTKNVMGNINSSYVVQFSGYREYNDIGDVALDDVSFSPQCFGAGIYVDFATRITSRTNSTATTTLQASPPTAAISTVGVPQNRTETIVNGTRYEFGTCGAFGRFGPTQFQCDSVYKTTPVQVQVLDKERFRGVQVWTVPENGTYFINAQGAGGGNGVKTVKGSRGGFIEAKFNLVEGEELYILVGQKGAGACSALQVSNKVKEICTTGLPESQLEDDNVYTALGVGGGGGGGGASFVFKVNNKTGEVIPLLVAGGGGGLAYRKISDEEHQLDPDCGEKIGGPGTNGFTHPYGAGGGGGFNDTTFWEQAGKSFLEGAIGGDSCKNATELFNWSTTGGFGGGGGACSSGGGGGGYSGGNASWDSSLDHNGEGGSSYVHPDAMEPKLYTGHKADGFVEIQLLMNCQCQHICTIQSFQQKYYCECLNGKVLNEDGHSCSAEQTKAEGMELGYIVVISVACTSVLLIVAAVSLCLVHQHKKRKNLEAVRMELITASQSFTIRPSTANTSSLANPLVQQRRMMAEYNPNYDFVGAKYPEQQLLELNRNKLRLVRALGQGAFGEVYKGYLASVPHREGELAVAVKTLPVYSTEEAELDFLMEAVIMSKFNHPNIVKFLGVCFENHPRYIILELLEGGDLKSFLREMRAKPGISPSPLSMSDLLKLATDIAKGCQHLEERRFIHRDIAARNCLLTCKGNNRVAKIADFGMARDIYRSDYYKKGGKAMLPIKWMPPEAFLDGVFTTKTDVWSFGILFWEIFSMGYMPYPGRTNHDVMQYVTSGGRLEPPENCPTALYQLMSICWAAIPETRPTFSEIIEQLKRCSQNPEVLSADLPVFYMVPPSNKNLMNLKVTSNTPEEEEEDPGNFFHESESKEPLLTPSTPDSEKLDSRENCSDKFKLKKDKENNKFPSLFVQLPSEVSHLRNDKTPSVSVSGSQSNDHISSESPLLSFCDVTTQCGNEYQDMVKNGSNSGVTTSGQLGSTEDSTTVVVKSDTHGMQNCDSDSKSTANSDKQMLTDCWAEIVHKPTRKSMKEAQKPTRSILIKKNSANI